MLLQTKVDLFFQQYGGRNLDRVQFRAGAPFAEPEGRFGLTRRYRLLPARTSPQQPVTTTVVWGYPGIHAGIDRAKYDAVGSGVWAPFTSFKTEFRDWYGSLYGTDVLLHNENDFVIRISHMAPADIELLDRIRRGLPIAAGEKIGTAGSYGLSTAVHTHTEARAVSEEGERFLDELLRQRGFTGVDEPLAEVDVLACYAACDKTNQWSREQMLADYADLLLRNNIDFINKYKITFKPSASVGNPAGTVYSTLLAFDF